MAVNDQAIVIFITCSDFEEAEKISEKLLDRKLVACTNMVKEVASSYWWKNTIERATEFLLIAKSEKARFGEILKEVKKLHSYSVPEVIALPIVDGNPDYLKWIKESTA